MWVLKAVLVFLLIWAAWYVLWTVIFATLDIAGGHEPLPILIGFIIAVLLTGKILEHRKRKRGA
jgi:glucose uptake protein GlcU